MITDRNRADEERLRSVQAKADFIGHIMEGNRLLKEGELNAAINEFRKSIQINPNYYVSYNRLGLAFFKKEAWEECAAALNKSIEVNPAQVDTLYMLGTCYERMDLRQLAEEMFELAKSRRKTKNERPKAIKFEKHGSSRSKRRKPKPVSLPMCLVRSVGFIFMKPALLAPYFLFYLITSVLTLALNNYFFGSPFAKFPPFNANDKSQVLYYLIVAAFQVLVFIPLISSGMYTVQNIYKSRSTTFAYSLKHSYRHLFALVCTALFSFVMIGGIAAIAHTAASQVFKSAAVLDLSGKALAAKLAAAATAGLFAPFFAFVFQYVIIERKSFDDAVSKSVSTGYKRYLSTILMIIICVLPFSALTVVSYSSELVQFVLVGLVKVFFMAFAVVSMSVFFMEIKGHRFRGAGKRKTVQDQTGMDVPESDDETEPEVVVEDPISED